jgi:thermitase
MRGTILVAVAAAALASAGLARALTPNDPAWPREWGPRVTRASDLWDRTTGDARLVIAVVDTGVAPIPDLQGALVPGWNFVEGNAQTNDTQGHGTWVASIIAARGNNARDAAGYCWGCSVMPIRISDGHAPANTTTIARGIVWAVDHGARVVNVSLDGAGSDPAERSAVAYAASHDVLVVAAAGNSGDATLHYPAAYPSVLAVAGTDPSNALYSWSTRGDWVNIAAPGCATVVDANVGIADGCGSSFSPAAVSGIAGLLFSLDDTLTAARVASVLRSTAHAVAGIGGGTVDAMAAAYALGLIGTTPPSPSSTPPPVYTGLQVSTRSGVIKGMRVMKIKTGAGAVEIRFSPVSSIGCQLELQVGRQVVVSTGYSRVVTLHAHTTRGPHRLTVVCSSRKPTHFELTVESAISG